MLCTPLEFQYSQLNNNILQIGKLLYNQDTKRIIFEYDKNQVKDIIYAHFPKVKFEIIELYLNLIQQKSQQIPVNRIENETDFKTYIHQYILTPDDSALKFGKVQTITM